ncbi:MAG: hypothetical protein A2138_11880 [Deltaproteobacteria bacterium RBG_16_71_12]|nr:MAG: hypothetical protein A2138_11880 [Deltaproteobacteria bacterium RBG_16_71_12]
MNPCIPTRRLAAIAAPALVLALGCSETTVTVLTQAPPGRAAFVDSEARTLTVTRGVAVALECTAWTEDYAGPCRDLSAVLDDESLATILPVHLDALPGQTVRSSAGFEDETTVIGPADRAGFVLVAAAAGNGALTVTTPDGPAVSLDLVVEDPPALPADE